jgi:hypothetical protein
MKLSLVAQDLLFKLIEDCLEVGDDSQDWKKLDRAIANLNLVFKPDDPSQSELDIVEK